MSIIRLKTADEQEMIAALREAGFAFNEDDELITSTHNYFISMCGTLYKNTGVMLLDDEKNEYPEKVAIDGFHANLVTNSGIIAKSVLHITVHPKTKLSKIAGEK